MKKALVTCKLFWDAFDEFATVAAVRGVQLVKPEIPGQQLSAIELLEIIAPFEGVLAGDDEFSRTVMEAAPRLRIISKWGIGIDGIDQKAAKDLGIKVTNTPGVFGDELGDYALGYLLLLARRQHVVDARVRGGEWYKVRGSSLAGKTIGILGLGSSGRALVTRCKALGMTVLGFDVVPVDPGFVSESGVTLVPIPELFARADVVSLHVPATPETRQIVNSDSLALMNDGAWLINISRGSLVDEVALMAALDTGKIGAAALDVFENEPFTDGHPLAGYSNVVLGSHNGSNTHEAVERTNDLAFRNLMAGLGVQLD